jgi:hypothetical protein
MTPRGTVEEEAIRSVVVVVAAAGEQSQGRRQVFLGCSLAAAEAEG